MGFPGAPSAADTSLRPQEQSQYKRQGNEHLPIFSTRPSLEQLKRIWYLGLSI